MNRERRFVKIVIDRKAVLSLLAVALLGVLAATVASQQLSMTATYPIPAGVYNQIVTTGNSGTTPANTTLNSKAGNTILVPPTNASGNVGIGTATPLNKLDVEGGVAVGSYAGTNVAPVNGMIVSGNVGIGMVPNSALSVNGGVQLGDDTSACTAAKGGTQRWHAGTSQVCTGVAWTDAAEHFGGAYEIGTFNGVCGWPDGTVNPVTGGCSCPAGYRAFFMGQAYRWQPWDNTFMGCQK